jgi:putative glutamine amidotransferase
VTPPVVGITLGDGDRPGYHGMREDYARSVERAGAIPVVLPSLGPEHAGAVLDRVDGLVLSGGIDVDPALYGRPPHPKLGRVDRRRDDFELALTREALARDLPLLAICRGIQVLNVATGGTLVQDIPSEWKGAVTHDAPGRRTRRSHVVEVVGASRLGEVLGEGAVSVNSFHHQAIDELGAGLVVSARCPKDGLVEGVEMPGRAFVLGVQWHPESFWNERASFHALFDAHVAACRAGLLVRSR